MPPSVDQVIYAENPDPRSNALTLSYDDDARYLDKAVLAKDGPAIETSDEFNFINIDGKILYRDDDEWCDHLILFSFPSWKKS